MYYVIFHKHHKRNNVEISELISLVTKFYSLTIISTIIIICGILCIFDANSYKDERREVISRVSLGIVIISATIINYIFYIKRNLKDFNQEIREETKKKTMKIGEILELILFTIFLFFPIIRIPEFIGLFSNKNKFIIEIFKSLLLSVASLFLLYKLNPLDIRNKLGELQMKKLDSKIKIIIAVIIFIVIAFIIFRIYNLFVLIKYSNSICDYSYIKETSTSIQDQLVTIKEQAKSGDVYCDKTTSIYDGNESENWLYLDLNSDNEFFNTYTYSEDIGKNSSNNLSNKLELYKLDENFVSDLQNKKYDFKNNIRYYISQDNYILLIKELFLYPITYVGEYNGIKCDVLYIFNQKIYLDSNTGLEIGIEYYDENKEINYTINYEYSNNIPEEFSKLPDINNFENVIYYDFLNKKVEDLCEPQRAISNTGLNPGDILAENVDIKPNEENILFNLVKNSSKTLEMQINNLETYNELRGNFSNLRELTQEDFLTYNVYLLYKNGSKMNLIASHESKYAKCISYVVSEEKAENQNFLIIITPRYNINGVKFVISDSDIKINAEKANDVLNTYKEKIKQFFNIGDDYSWGTGEEFLTTLNNETFSNLTYINEGASFNNSSNIVWQINIPLYNMNNPCNLYCYIDANTGEFIGAYLIKL